MTLDTAQVVWNSTINQWVDPSTGEPIPPERITEEVFSHADAAEDNLEEFTVALYAGLITIEDWETAVALELQDGFMAESAFAVGGIANVDNAVLAATSLLLADQLGFLDGFAKAIFAGGVSQAQAISRIRQYGNAVGQAYWGQWQNGIVNPAFSGLHRLTRIPQDGSTDCRGRCRCHLENTGAGILWVTIPGRICDTCSSMESGNPWAPML